MRLFAARKKRARPCWPGSAIRTLPASELVAQSGAGDIDRGPEAEIVFIETIHRRDQVGMSDPAEVVVQPFAAQEPVIRKLPFEPYACHPAELVGVGRVGFGKETKRLR